MFTGLKVIELANVLAGPMVGMFFSEQNARVIKVENKTTGGDMTRNWKLPSEDKNSTISAYYASINYNKEVLFLDLSNPEDKEVIYNHIIDSDILISNFKAGAAEKLGMDYKTLSKINSKLIYGHISGFGENSHRPAFDLVLQAETGYMSMNGQPDSPPTKMPVAFIDILAAHQLKEGILTALWKRERSGCGSCVTTSLYAAAVASLSNQATNWLMAKHIPERMGSLHPNIAPYGEIFTTKDSVSLTFAIGTNKQFIELCNLLKINKVAKDEKFITNNKRVMYRNDLQPLIQQEIEKKISGALISGLDKNNIPYGIIKNIKQVFEDVDTQNFLLIEKIENTNTSRVRTVAFNIK